ncbi:hypothetical protein FHG87_022749 [Trinorchestia longiramus]|nr:hypothetical protein FHG87_022749 [Trinorchestia longiramus]
MGELSSPINMCASLRPIKPTTHDVCALQEIQTRMNNVVKELVSIRVQSQSFVNFSDFTYANISESLNATGEVVSKLSTRLHERVNTSRVREAAFKDEFTHEAELVSARVQSGVSGTLTTNHLALNQVEETEQEGRRFVNSAAAAWSEYYLNHEHERRLDADRLASNLQSYTHHTQNILTGLNNAAQTHEQVLEEQRADFSRFVRKRQEALDSQCHAISDWSALMSSELRRRDEDLHRFLSDNLHFSVSPIASYPGDLDAYLVSGLLDNSLAYHSSSHHYPPPDGPPDEPLTGSTLSSGGAFKASHEHLTQNKEDSNAALEVSERKPNLNLHGGSSSKDDFDSSLSPLPHHSPSVSDLTPICIPSWRGVVPESCMGSPHYTGAPTPPVLSKAVTASQLKEEPRSDSCCTSHFYLKTSQVEGLRTATDTNFQSPNKNSRLAASIFWFSFKED